MMSAPGASRHKTKGRQMPPKKPQGGAAGAEEALQASREHLEGPQIISEEAMTAHTATLESLAERHGLDIGSLVGDLRDGMLEQFKQRLKPWGQMLAGDQHDVAAALEFSAKSFVRRAVIQLAAENRPTVRGRLKKFAHDGAKIIATIEVPLTDDATILAINHASGKEVLIVTADADPFMGERRPADISADQGGLAFEAGSDRIPADDSDLANAGAASMEEPAEAEEEQ